MQFPCQWFLDMSLNRATSNWCGKIDGPVEWAHLPYQQISTHFMWSLYKHKGQCERRMYYNPVTCVHLYFELDNPGWFLNNWIQVKHAPSAHWKMPALLSRYVLVLLTCQETVTWVKRTFLFDFCQGLSDLFQPLACWIPFWKYENVLVFIFVLFQYIFTWMNRSANISVILIQTMSPPLSYFYLLK